MANNWSVTWKPARGRERVLRWMDDIQRELLDTGKLIRWAGPRVRELVASRTSRGIDVEDDPFVPYSERYAERRKGGRRKPVTLAEEGMMLSLLAFRPTGSRSGKVFVRTGGRPNRQAIAAAHHRGLGNVPVRKWLGLSPTDLAELNEKTIDRIEAFLRGTPAGVSKRGSRATKGQPWRVKNPA